MRARYWICLGILLGIVPAARGAGLFPTINWPFIPKPQIWNGHKVIIEDYPWQVAVRIYRPVGYEKCGGVLIAADWILTAAHCFAGVQDGDVTYVAGRDEITRAYLNTGTWQAIKKLFILDCFTGQPDGHGIRSNDLALVQLRDPDPSFRGGALSLPDKAMPALKALEVSGWGRTATGAESEVLQAADIDFIDDTTCSAAFPGSIKSSMLCAGHQNVGTCAGDSGGPLVTKAATTPKYLVGVVSSGDDCNYALEYGVYSRVSSYRPWIDSAIETHGWVDHLSEAKVPDPRKACTVLGINGS